MNEEAISKGIISERYELDEYLKKEKFTNERLYIFIVSSTGDGEFPDNGNNFYWFLMKSSKDNSDFSNVRFTLLGLGSSDYSTFMGVPNYLHKTLTKLKAKFFYNYGKADEATSLEKGIEPWKDGLWSALQQEISLGVIEDKVNHHIEEMKFEESEFTVA